MVITSFKSSKQLQPHARTTNVAPVSFHLPEGLLGKRHDPNQVQGASGQLVTPLPG